MGLMSTSHLEQEAAIHTLSTLMTITPAEAYAEFEKHLKSSPDRSAHDMLSENDIQIFHTPEGMLSSEQGVYIAESVASNNMKQVKGRFRTYENNDIMDNGNTTSSGRRDTAGKERAGAGKKDTGKPTRKPEKQKTTKEEAREMQLREEADVREKVMNIQKNLSLLLKALGEMAIAEVAEVAEDVWDHYDHEFGTVYSGLFRGLSHVNYNVRMAAADALAAVLNEYPDTLQESLATLFSLYIRDSGIGGDNIDSGWLGRQGTALALHSAADVLRTKDLPVVMTFHILDIPSTDSPNHTVANLVPFIINDSPM